MTVYARSDVMSVSIPVSSGGCGNSHSRPVTNGAPVKTWGLTCTDCEKYLRGDYKGKIIRVTPGDKDLQIPSRMEHVADGDPHWSTTPEGIPLNPDEQHINKIRAKKGDEELSRLQALIAAKAAGIDVPANAMWLLEQTFDPRVIKGTVICQEGHENTSGAKFCATCGVKMDGKAQLQIGNPDGQEIDVFVTQDDYTVGHHPAIKVDALPLRTLHVATLKKMCRDKSLSDKGKKEELIARLGGLCREHLVCAGTVADPAGDVRPVNVPHGPGARIAKPTSASGTASWKTITGYA